MSKTTLKSPDIYTDYPPILESKMSSDPPEKDRSKAELVKGISRVIRSKPIFISEDDKQAVSSLMETLLKSFKVCYYFFKV